jgi:hypothetical protein
MSGYIPEKSFAVVAETRRRWTLAEKAAVVAEIAGSSVSAVARKHGIASSLVFRWRRELGLGSKKAKRAGFVFWGSLTRAAIVQSVPGLKYWIGPISLGLHCFRRTIVEQAMAARPDHAC